MSLNFGFNVRVRSGHHRHPNTVEAAELLQECTHFFFWATLYIPYSTFTITKVQVHVSAINVGHLQVVHEALNDKLYLHVSGEFTVCGVGWVRDLVLCL